MEKNATNPEKRSVCERMTEQTQSHGRFIEKVFVARRAGAFGLPDKST
jgi:hypothetical protein